MKKLNMYINAPLLAWVREQAAKDGISVAEFVRRVLDDVRKNGK